MRTDGKPVGKAMTMPFTIIEVKLKCAGDAIDMPLWLEALLTQSVHAAKVKISKYNFGCAMLHTPLCRTFPAWISFAQNPFEGETPSPFPHARTPLVVRHPFRII